MQSGIPNLILTILAPCRSLGLRSWIVTKVAIGIVIVRSVMLPLRAGQPTQQRNVPTCAQSPGDPTRYPDNMVRPRYPKDALRNGAEGQVELRAVIAPDGKS